MTTTTDIHVDVARVFTNEDGEFGNLLGIVDGATVAPDDRQRVAAQVGYSETVFIDDAERGQFQIFTPLNELPFAGHPTVGAAWWLRSKGYAADQLHVPAGKLTVTREGDVTNVRARGDWAPGFTWRDMATPADVEAADASTYATGQHYVWAWIDEEAGRIRARMFAPGFGIPEDEATGSAAVALTCLLERDLDIIQGRGSRITTRWEGAGWVTLGGRVVSEQALTLPR
jgi:predicted PhzF superfamily epimerase YddE/YHI9